MQTVKREDNVVYVKRQDNRKVVKIFGKKYKLRESARIKYEIIGGTFTALFVLISLYVMYCALWVAGF